MIHPPNSLEKIREHNFRDPSIVDRNMIRQLRSIHEPLCKSIKTGFFTRYRFECEITMVELTYTSGNEYFLSVTPPSVIYMLNEKKLGDWALINLKPEFCVNIVEFLGGNIILNEMEVRVLSSLEQRLMARVMNFFLGEVKNVYSGYTELNFKNLSFQSDLSSQIAHAYRQTAVVVNYEVNYYGKKGHFDLVYSYDSLVDWLDPAVEASDPDSKSDLLDEETKNRLEKEIKKSNTTLSVELGSTKMSLKDILNIQVGDILHLDQKVSAPLKTYINNLEKLSGYPGERDGRKAIRIFEIFDDEE